MEAPKPTVLLVDDDPTILAAIKRQLRSEGYRILSTEDATTVLSILQAEEVDVLVSDVNMPKMSGLELLAQVRVAFPAVSRVLLTGQTSIATAVEAINRGEVFRYLQKPWADGELREALRAAVRLAASHRRSAAIEIAAQRRARALDRVESQHPEVRDVPRSADGVYALPELSRIAVEPSSPAVALLRDLLQELSSPSPSPSAPKAPSPSATPSPPSATPSPPSAAPSPPSAAPSPPSVEPSAGSVELSDATTRPRQASSPGAEANAAAPARHRGPTLRLGSAPSWNARLSEERRAREAERGEPASLMEVRSAELEEVSSDAPARREPAPSATAREERARNASPSAPRALVEVPHGAAPAKSAPAPEGRRAWLVAAVIAAAAALALAVWTRPGASPTPVPATATPPVASASAEAPAAPPAPSTTVARVAPVATAEPSATAVAARPGAPPPLRPRARPSAQPPSPGRMDDLKVPQFGAP